MRLCSCQTIVLVSVLLEFAKLSLLLYRVSDDFGSRLLSMVPLSNNFIMWRYMDSVSKPLQTKTKTDEEKKEKDRQYEKENDSVWKDS